MESAIRIIHARRWLRRVLIVLAVVLSVWLISAIYPIVVCMDRFAFTIRANQIGVYTATQPMTADGEMWRFGGARMSAWPESVWLPSSNTSGMSTETAGQTTFSAYVTSYFLPIHFLVGCLLLVAVPLFVVSRNFPSGHCRRCGYNLTGNTSGTCPECGTTVAMLVGGSET